jgi:hypothetical protein
MRRPAVVENVSRPVGGEALPRLAPRETSREAPDSSHAESYRYLEDDADPRTVAWQAEQLAFARRLLDRLPLRAEIARELAASDMGHAVDTVIQMGASTFYRWHSEQREHLGLLQPGRGSREIVVPEANMLDHVVPSPSGRLLAVQYSERGNIMTRVFDVDRGPVEPPSNEMFLPKWAPDERSFFYLRAAHRGVTPSIARHIVGEPQSADRTVFGAGTPSDKLLRDWTADSSLSFEVGQRTLSVVIRRSALAGVYRRPDEPPVFTAAVAPLDAVASGAVSFRQVDVSQAAWVLPEADDSLLVATWVGKHLRVTRAVLPASGSALLADDPPPGAHIVKAADALYFVSEAQVVRQATAASRRETIQLPGPLLSFDANPLTPGLRIQVASATRGGWFSLGPKTDFVRMVFDVQQPELAAVEEVTPIEIAGAPARLTLVHAADARRDASHPAILHSFTVLFPQVELRSWLSHGGVFASCSGTTSPGKGPTREQRERQWADRISDCARAIQQTGWVSAIGLVGNPFNAAVAARAGAADPGLYGALVLDSRGDGPAPLRSLDWFTATLHSGQDGAEESTARGFPPLLVLLEQDRATPARARKLVAKVNAENRDRPAALLIEHDENSAQDEARLEAFLFLTLAGRGKERLPNWVRRDGESAPPAR